MITRWSPALAAAALLAACAGPPASSPSPMQAPARIERPIPYPVTPPPEYQRAVAAVGAWIGWMLLVDLGHRGWSVVDINPNAGSRAVRRPGCRAARRKGE